MCKLAQGRHPHWLHRSADAVPDPCVVGRGFAPRGCVSDGALALQQPRRASRATGEGVSSAARPRVVPRILWCQPDGGQREARTAPGWVTMTCGPLLAQSLPVRANARFPGGGHCQALLSKGLRQQPGYTKSSCHE